MSETLVKLSESVVWVLLFCGFWQMNGRHANTITRRYLLPRSERDYIVSSALQSSLQCVEVVLRMYSSTVLYACLFECQAHPHAGSSTMIADFRCIFWTNTFTFTTQFCHFCHLMASNASANPIKYHDIPRRNNKNLITANKHTHI